MLIFFFFCIACQYSTHNHTTIWVFCSFLKFWGIWALVSFIQLTLTPGTCSLQYCVWTENLVSSKLCISVLWLQFCCKNFNLRLPLPMYFVKCNFTVLLMSCKTVLLRSLKLCMEVLINQAWDLPSCWNCPLCLYWNLNFLWTLQ